MAGLCSRSSRTLCVLGRPLSHSATVVIVLAALSISCNASSLSSIWQQKFPHTSIPQTLQSLESPISASLAQDYLHQLKGDSQQALNQGEFCSSAGIYCARKAVVSVRGPQPRVCIPPFFMYMYGVLPCPRSGSSASALQTSSIFFTPESLTVGHEVQLPDTLNDLKGMRFLPLSLAKALPELNEENEPKLLRFYGVEEGSDMELEMKNTLAHCSYKSENEVKACMTTGEGIVSFVSDEVGQNAVVYAPSALPTQVATVSDIVNVNSAGEKVVACHDMKFPSLLYSCHITETAQLMDISLKLADGHVEHMQAICHLDTSYWNPSHIAFQVLNTEPGKSSVCHWFPENSFIFVQAGTKGN